MSLVTFLNLCEGKGGCSGCKSLKLELCLKLRNYLVGIIAHAQALNAFHMTLRAVKKGPADFV